ncbi:MAG: hypothetical protein IJO93_06415 [Clostridia bacterium]|nr:hypothetical protein [Clostridia bacterium]
MQSEKDEEFSLASGYIHDGVFRAVYTNAGNEITLPEATGKRAVSVDNKKDSLAFYVID